MLILLPLPPRNLPHHHRHCAGRRRTRASPSAEPETGIGTPCAPTDWKRKHVEVFNLRSKMWMFFRVTNTMDIPIRRGPMSRGVPTPGRTHLPEVLCLEGYLPPGRTHLPEVLCLEGYPPPGRTHLPEVPCPGGTHPLDIPTGGTWDQRYPTPWKGYGIRDTHPPLWPERHLWKHYLPTASLVQGKTVKNKYDGDVAFPHCEQSLVHT